MEVYGAGVWRSYYVFGQVLTEDSSFRDYVSSGLNAVDADFCGNWDKEFASSDHRTTESRFGWIVSYAHCPVSWASKLQTKVALSTAEDVHGCLPL